MMEILEAEASDLDDIKHLIEAVAEYDILPELTEEGKAYYKSTIIPNIDSAFDKSRFKSLKIVVSGTIIGFGALRDSNYLTLLFVAKSKQGSGLGRQLMNALLESTDAPEITLRSSIGAVAFYKAYGFEATGAESVFNGICFVPMKLIRDSS